MINRLLTEIVILNTTMKEKKGNTSSQPHKEQLLQKGRREIFQIILFLFPGDLSQHIHSIFYTALSSVSLEVVHYLA